MGSKDYYSHGNNNVECDLCGQKYKRTDCKMQWNNLFTCPTCFEPRNPQDFVKGVPDNQRAPITRYNPTITFVTNQITPDDL
jgi:hypothetical protein